MGQTLGFHEVCELSFDTDNSQKSAATDIVRMREGTELVSMHTDPD